MDQIDDLKKEVAEHRREIGTDEAVVRLQRLGSVSMFQYRDGTWKCRVKLAVSLPGFDGEIGCGGHEDSCESLNKAVNECLTRAVRVMREIKDSIRDI